MRAQSEVTVDPPVSALLTSLVYGDRDAWLAINDRDPGRLAQEAERHGLVPLLSERAAALHVPASPLVLDLRRRAMRDATADVLRERALVEALEALAAQGIRALVMKGADLAYSIYPRPDLRPRTDTDLLIAPADRANAASALAVLGYVAAPQSGGDLLMYQEPFVLRRDDAIVHVIDLHWRVMNPQRFGDVLSFEESWEAGEPRPALSPSARGLTAVHALLLAAVHRVAHHFDAARLIWSHDLHLLAPKLDTRDWEAFTELAVSRNVAGACLRGLRAACGDFGTVLQAGVLKRLELATSLEPAYESYLSPRALHVARVLSDVAHLPTWAARARLTRQHLFPSARYMREVYAPQSGAPLALLYTWRIVRGSRKWLAPGLKR